MTKPSVNAIGGAIAVIALGAVFYFGAQPSSTTPTPTPPPTVSTLAPTLEPQVLKPPVVPPPVEKPTSTRRVLKGVKTNGKVDCTLVPPSVTRQYTKDQVIAAAKEYGLSPAQISALRVCLN